VLFKFYKELDMTTAFELGCLSAMEKISENFSAQEIAQNQMRAEEKPPFIHPETSARVARENEGRRQMKMVDETRANSNKLPYTPGAASPPSDVGLFSGAGSFLRDSLFGSVEQQRAAQTAAQDLKDQNLMLARHKKDYGQAGQGRLAPEPVAGGKYQSFAGLNPDDEAAARAAIAPKSEQAAAAGSPAAGSMLSSLKNPYVLGGLGAAGLGLGGYAAYRAYQNSKKKKRPM
jgi:hypothetical protein